MKIKINESTPDRRVVAVVGSDGNGLFFRGNDGPSVYVDAEGRARKYADTFDSIVAGAKMHGRRPVYEGDEIVLTF